MGNETNMFSRAGQMLRGIGLSRAVTVGATVGLTSSSASYCSTTAPTTQVRIAQYNILSDPLDAPDHYIHCDPNDLDHEIRFQRVAAKLEEQMRAGAVLCLQEVSRNWAGRLIPLFEKHGYTYASALTGSKFGGYMGQCLAWPPNGSKLPISQPSAWLTRSKDGPNGLNLHRWAGGVA